MAHRSSLDEIDDIGGVLDRYRRVGSSEAALAADLIELLVHRRRQPAIAASEAEVWASVGASFDDDPAAEAEALVAAASMMAELELRSFPSPSAIAAELGVTASRVSQMTGTNKLFAFIDHAGVLRYPRWQVIDHRALPGLAQVLPAVRPGVHPSVIDRWFTTANVDLRLGDDDASPSAWLASGGPPEVLVAAAAAL